MKPRILETEAGAFVFENFRPESDSIPENRRMEFAREVKTGFRDEVLFCEFLIDAQQKDKFASVFRLGEEMPEKLRELMPKENRAKRWVCTQINTPRFEGDEWQRIEIVFSRAIGKSV